MCVWGDYVNCPIPALTISAFGVHGNQPFTGGTGEKGQNVRTRSVGTGEPGLVGWLLGDATPCPADRCGRPTSMLHFPASSLWVRVGHLCQRPSVEVLDL